MHKETGVSLEMNMARGKTPVRSVKFHMEIEWQAVTK